jgi:F420-dependent oxidoreductase-like protein
VPVRIGFQVWPQNTTWPAMREVAQLADTIGVESIWTWDHFYALSGEEERPNFEAWQILPAWAAVTQRVRIGALVSGITYRHPAVIANMAATLDHVSNGRVNLGIGAAWNQTEHRAYGIELGTPGARSTRFAEATKIIRRLVDGDRVTMKGKYYKLQDAVLNVRPVQKRLPIMIGGGGEQRTLRTTARYADMWHGFGTADLIKHKLEVLRQHCTEVGRDPNEIVPYGGSWLVIRDDKDEAERVLADIAKHHPGMNRPNAFVGNTDEVTKHLKSYWDIGLRGWIAGFAFPYDTESMKRLAEDVRPRLERVVGVAA